MRYPEFDLPTADGGHLSNKDLEGKPWYAYMARHPGCYVCQHKLSQALEHRDEIRAMGGDILLFFNASEDYVRMWTQKSDLPKDLTVVMDPDAKLYEEVGTIRGKLVPMAIESAGSLWRSRGSISKWRLSNNDMLRMGADVAVGPDGEMVFRHICRNPEDRANPVEVVGALRVSVPQVAVPS